MSMMGSWTKLLTEAAIAMTSMPKYDKRERDNFVRSVMVE